MTTVAYGFGTTLRLPQAEAIAQVRQALQVEGFGVLTEIDVQQTLKQKLGAEVAPYTILGACNPPLAHRALEQEPEVGLLLPCNVVVRALDATTTRVDVADPEMLVNVTGNAALASVATEAGQRLRRVVAALAPQTATA